MAPPLQTGPLWGQQAPQQREAGTETLMLVRGAAGMIQ